MDRSKIIIIGGVILIEIIILSLFFTGTVIIPSKNYKNVLSKKSTIQPARLMDVQTSNNYIYVASSSFSIPIQNVSLVNITQYDSNLNQVWTNSYNFTLDVNIVAATDQSVLVANRTFLFIFNKEGVQVSFNMTKETNGGRYLNCLAIGSNYFVPYLKYLSSNKFSLDGHLLKPDGTSTILFHEIIDNANATIPAQPFYRDSNTIEIPLINFESKRYHTRDPNFLGIPYIYFSNFTRLQYNINTNLVKTVPTNVADKVNQIQADYLNKYTSKTSYYPDFQFIPYDNDFLIYETDTYNSPVNNVIKLISPDGNTAKSTTTQHFSAFFQPFVPLFPAYYTYIANSFQINNKCYINQLFLGKKSLINIELMTYTHYMLRSTINFENFTILFNNDYAIYYAYAIKFGNNILYFGSLESNLLVQDNYFLKIYEINPQLTFSDYLYHIPLLIKLLIGAIFILPTAFYLYKRFIPKIPESEMYPVNTE